MPRGKSFRGQCGQCFNVRLLNHDDLCDECSFVNDHVCDIAERLEAALASTALSLSKREREILTVRMHNTARQTAQRCRIGMGVMACLESKVLEDCAN